MVADKVGDLQSRGRQRHDARCGRQLTRLTLKTRAVAPITVPPIDAEIVREMREALKMSRHVAHLDLAAFADAVIAADRL